MSLPLEGIRVIDLTVVWAGPLATKFLAELGAEVIRPESAIHFPSSTKGFIAYPPKGLDKANYRAFPNYDPGERPYNRHPMYNQHAMNKKSFTCELDTPEGQEAFRRLVRISHVLIENNAIRIAEKLGFDQDTLKELNPDLIVIRMPPLGLNGPYANVVGWGVHFEALSGVTSLRGYQDADPSLTPATYHMDDASGAAAAFVTMAAIFQKLSGGKASFIEFPQVENMLNQMGEVFLDYSMNNRFPEVHGNTHPFYVQGVYPCEGHPEQDNWIAVTLESDAQWEFVKELMGHPEWTQDPKFATLESCRENQKEWDQLFATWTKTQEKYDLFHKLQAQGIPSSPLLNEAEAFRDPHLEARGFFKPLTSNDVGTHLHASHWYKLSKMELKWEHGAPTLGQHNEYVYKELLGFTDEEYEEMAKKGLLNTEYPRPAV